MYTNGVPIFDEVIRRWESYRYGFTRAAGTHCEAMRMAYLGGQEAVPGDGKTEIITTCQIRRRQKVRMVALPLRRRTPYRFGHITDGVDWGFGQRAECPRQYTHDKRNYETGGIT